MARATVAISDDFLSAFVKLPRKEQAKTSEFISKFRSNPESPGIHYEKIRSGLDDKICSVRIDLEYRGIVVRQASSNTYILLWVDHHDEAYRWAARKKCMVNPVTGGIQVFDVDTTPVSVPADGAALPAKKLFDRIADKDLMRLGVPEELLPLVRSLNDRDDFLKAAGRLPKDTYENLNWLVEGIPLKEVFDMISAEALKEKPTDNLSDALERPESMKSFTVVKGEEELRRILAEPLENGVSSFIRPRGNWYRLCIMVRLVSLAGQAPAKRWLPCIGPITWLQRRGKGSGFFLPRLLPTWQRISCPT